MGTFVRRLLALTVVWLLATAALTYAAAHRIASAPLRPATTPTETTAATAAPTTIIVPDVRRQAYVFAKGTLGDAGFGWRIQGAVKGYASNTVVSQTPEPGTRVVDTGNPLILLRLERPAGAKELGAPEEASAVPATKLKLADLALADTPPLQTAATAAPAPAAPAPVVAKKVAAPKKKVAVKTPAHRWSQSRPPAFVVPGARREPLDEMPIADRADMLLHWLAHDPKPTDANVRYWLYQHAWIVAGARMGWWHGSAALKTLVDADQRAWALWGIGARSSALARHALAEVEARSH
jgi:hypothetical protein